MVPLSKYQAEGDSMAEDKVIIKEGIISQSLSGFYSVRSEGQTYVTKPRGNFRHQQLKPLVGDHVTFEWEEGLDPKADQALGRLIEVLPRRNQFVRPSVVNVDDALVVMSLVEPDFSYSLVDQFLASVTFHGIEPHLILTKYDLLLAQEGEEQAQDRVAQIQALYEAAGYTVTVMDPASDALANLSQLLHQGLYVVMGQSGVGKSTLLNQLLPQADIETGEISHYLGRGRHTTREVTLYPLNQALIADTPGFSALDFEQIEKEQVTQLFPEIQELSQECRFRSCLHLEEPGCAVKQALEAGNLAASRYQSYCQLVQKIDQRKPQYHLKKRR